MPESAHFYPQFRPSGEASRNYFHHAPVGSRHQQERLCPDAVLQKSCPHANACLTCPLFVTTAEFLPQHRKQLDDTRALIARAETDGHTRLAEMNRTVETNLLTIITTLEADQHDCRCAAAGSETCCGKESSDAPLTTATTSSPLPNAVAPTPSNAPAKPCRNSAKPAQRRTVTQIAAHAGVSRSWLYAQPELRDQLRRLTAISETAESGTCPNRARVRRLAAATPHTRARTHPRTRRRKPSTARTRSHSCTDSSAPTASPAPTSRTPSTTQTTQITPPNSRTRP